MVDAPENDIQAVRKWLDDGCPSWGVPVDQISELCSALATLEAQLAEARKALERIEARTRSVPSDTAEDDKRDKYHANSIARRALTGGKDDA